MNTLKRTLAIVAALAMTTTAFVGCDKDDESSSSKKDDSSSSKVDDSSDSSEEDPAVELKTDGKELNVWGWNEEFITTMMENYYLRDNPLPEGVTYKPTNTNGSDVYQQQIDTAFGAGEAIDIYVIEAGYAPAYLDSEWTVPLSSIGIKDSELEANQYQYTIDIAKATTGDDAGKIKGSSWQAAPGGFCYRADLAESLLGVKTPDEMQEKIGDWDKFIDAAKIVKEESGGKTKMATAIEEIWQVFSSTRETAWVDNGALVISDEVKDFMELAKTMKTENYYLGTGWWNDAWFAAGQTDETMGYFVSTWGIGDPIMMKATGGEKGENYGKWSLCEGPQAYYWGGTWIVVGPDCDNQDIAADIIRYFTVENESMKKYAVGYDADGDGKFDGDDDFAPSNDYMNNDAVMTEIVNSDHTNGLFKDGVSQYPMLQKAAKNITSLKITGYDMGINDAFNTAFTNYASGEASYDEAIDQFKKDVKTKFNELGGTD